MIHELAIVGRLLSGIALIGGGLIKGDGKMWGIGMILIAVADV